MLALCRRTYDTRHNAAGILERGRVSDLHVPLYQKQSGRPRPMNFSSSRATMLGYNDESESDDRNSFCSSMEIGNENDEIDSDDCCSVAKDKSRESIEIEKQKKSGVFQTASYLQDYMHQKGKPEISFTGANNNTIITEKQEDTCCGHRIEDIKRVIIPIIIPNDYIFSDAEICSLYSETIAFLTNPICTRFDKTLTIQEVQLYFQNKYNQLQLLQQQQQQQQVETIQYQQQQQNMQQNYQQPQQQYYQQQQPQQQQQQYYQQPQQQYYQQPQQRQQQQYLQQQQQQQQYLQQQQQQQYLQQQQQQQYLQQQQQQQQYLQQQQQQQQQQQYLQQQQQQERQRQEQSLFRRPPPLFSTTNQFTNNAATIQQQKLPIMASSIPMQQQFMRTTNQPQGFIPQNRQLQGQISDLQGQGQTIQAKIANDANYLGSFNIRSEYRIQRDDLVRQIIDRRKELGIHDENFDLIDRKQVFEIDAYRRHLIELDILLKRKRDKDNIWTMIVTASSLCEVGANFLPVAGGLVKGVTQGISASRAVCERALEDMARRYYPQTLEYSATQDLSSIIKNILLQCVAQNFRNQHMRSSSAMAPIVDGAIALFGNDTRTKSFIELIKGVLDYTQVDDEATILNENEIGTGRTGGLDLQLRKTMYIKQAEETQQRLALLEQRLQEADEMNQELILYLKTLGETGISAESSLEKIFDLCLQKTKKHRRVEKEKQEQQTETTTMTTSNITSGQPHRGMKAPPFEHTRNNIYDRPKPPMSAKKHDQPPVLVTTTTTTNMQAEYEIRNGSHKNNNGFAADYIHTMGGRISLMEEKQQQQQQQQQQQAHKMDEKTNGVTKVVNLLVSSGVVFEPRQQVSSNSRIEDVSVNQTTPKPTVRPPSMEAFFLEEEDEEEEDEEVRNEGEKSSLHPFVPASASQSPMLMKNVTNDVNPNSNKFHSPGQTKPPRTPNRPDSVSRILSLQTNGGF